MHVQQRTKLSVRPFRVDDYAAVAHVHSASFPEFSMDAEEWQFEDAKRPPHCRSARWIGEWDGRVVGFAEYGQRASTYHPRRFQLGVAVHPDFLLRGIGRTLFDVVLTAVCTFDPLSVDEWSREDMAVRVGFLERRGFVEDMRLWTSELDLTTFDASRFAHLAPGVEAQGIRLQSLAELGPQDTSVQRKLYDLWLDIRRDVPQPPQERLVDVPFEQFWDRQERGQLWPAGYFVALDGDHYIGTSHLWLSPEPDLVRTGLTGVRRAYRRRGIALALKIRSLESARAHGYRRVQTENELHNQGMLAINDDLGFVKNPAWVHYTKSFGA